MGRAKAIEVKPIRARPANALVKRLHYSGKVVPNSQLHLGVFLDGRLLGAMQFGPPILRHAMLPLVRGSRWDSVVELNRLAFDEALPRNSESRAMAVAFRLLRRHTPQVKWVLSFADGCQCGDGAIYRASGFLLTQVKRNVGQLRMPDGSVRSTKALNHPQHMGPNGEFGTAMAKAAGAVPLEGYQFRYVKFLDPTWRERLTVPVIPFDRIPAAARMYRGISASTSVATGHPPAVGGAAPTLALHPSASPQEP